MKNVYKIDQKIGKVGSIVRGCFQRPGYMSKKGNLDVSDEKISTKSEENRDGTYNQCTVVDKQSQPIWYLSSQAIFWQSFFRILFRSTKYIEKHISKVFPMSHLDQPNF